MKSEKTFSIDFLAKSLLILAICTTFFSCKKDEATVPQSNPIEGIWDGSYHYSGSTTQYSYRLNIKENGVLERMNGNSKDGEGTWSLNGTQFTGTYKNLPLQTITYTITGSYDATAKTITGTTTSSSQVIFPSYFLLTKM
jgi:hypothetical protein